MSKEIKSCDVICQQQVECNGLEEILQDFLERLNSFQVTLKLPLEMEKYS